MYSYRLQLKILKNVDQLSQLDPGKQALFSAILNLVTTLLAASEEVVSSSTQPDFSILVKSNADVYEVLSTKLGNNVDVEVLSETAE